MSTTKSLLTYYGLFVMIIPTWESLRKKQTVLHDFFASKLRVWLSIFGTKTAALALGRRCSYVMQRVSFERF